MNMSKPNKTNNLYCLSVWVVKSVRLNRTELILKRGQFGAVFWPNHAAPW